MLRSMTGYGVGQASAEGHRITVEIRSVNNRFLDINLRMPRVLNPFDAKLRKIISARLQRGRVSVQVNEIWEKDASPKLNINIARARSSLESLRNMASELGIKDEVSLDNLLTTGDFFDSDDDPSLQDQFWEMTRFACRTALENLIEVSLQEGENLAVDLQKRLQQIISEKNLIEEFARGQLKTYQERLRARLGELYDDDRLDPARLETEFAISADKLDISEELVRLSSHIDIFKNTLSNKEAPGKALGFILQEMGREANTIASKSWLNDISKSSIAMKEILEQIREQVQNIE